jgi:hypothetical protein
MKRSPYSYRYCPYCWATQKGVGNAGRSNLLDHIEKDGKHHFKTRRHYYCRKCKRGWAVTITRDVVTAKLFPPG